MNRARWSLTSLHTDTRTPRGPSVHAVSEGVPPMVSPVLQLAFNFDEPNAVQLPASTSAGPLPVWVDADDVKRLKGRKLAIGSHGYAQIWDGERTVLLHRWLMGCKVRDGLYVDQGTATPSTAGAAT